MTVEEMRDLAERLRRLGKEDFGTFPRFCVGEWSRKNLTTLWQDLDEVAAYLDRAQLRPQFRPDNE